MKKIRKKSFSDNLKDQNNLPNKSELKNLGAKTERKKIKDKIKTILQKE